VVIEDPVVVGVVEEEVEVVIICPV